VREGVFRQPWRATARSACSRVRSVTPPQFVHWFVYRDDTVKSGTKKSVNFVASFSTRCGTFWPQYPQMKTTVTSSARRTDVPKRRNIVRP
jgi:hypothetical protein